MDERSDEMVIPRSKIINSDKKGPANAKKLARQDRKVIEGGADGSRARTNSTFVAVSPVTSRWTVNTLLPVKCPIMGKHRRAKGRL
jgi:predicted RNA-binding protein